MTSRPDLGPPMSAEERERLTAERYRRNRLVYGDETLNKVRELLDKGATYKEIVERTDFPSVGSLRSFCNARGLHPAPYQQGYGKEVHDVVRQMTEAGATFAEIVAVTPFPSGSSLGQFCRVWGYRAPRGRQQPTPQERIAHIWQRVREGWKTREIAAELKIPRNTVCGLIHSFQLRDMRERPEVFVRFKEKRRITAASSCTPSTLRSGVRSGPAQKLSWASGPVPSPHSIRGVSLARV